MRHRIYGKHLGRDKDERKNLFKGLLSSLFISGTIQTSEAKAKAIKPLIDKVINIAKTKGREDRLELYIADKKLRERLVKEIVPKLGTRTSGYTSLIRMGTRSGDQTTIVKMSLIGAEELKKVESRVPGLAPRSGTGKSQESGKKIEAKEKKGENPSL